MEAWIVILIVAAIFWFDPQPKKVGAIGMLIGAAIGSFIGIAAFGSAISGIIPCAVVGYLLGAFAAKAS